MTNPVIIGNATLPTRIYALCEFPCQTPRYVGKTVRPLMGRLKSHLLVARKPRLPVGYWLAKRKREGKQICIKWLETVDAGLDWQARERYWIAKHRADGAQLLNLTDGGEGLSGHKFSESHRAKIAAALRTGAHCSCIQCGEAFWRKANEVAKGENKFCSKSCYFAWQKGKSKSNARGLMGAAGRAAAIVAKRKRREYSR